MAGHYHLAGFPCALVLSDPGNRCLKLADIYGLDQMLEEAGLGALLNVTIHAVTTEGNGRDWALSENLPDQVVAGAIRQAQVTDDQVKRLARRTWPARF